MSTRVAVKQCPMWRGPFMYGKGNVTKAFFRPGTDSASKMRLSFHTLSQCFSYRAKPRCLPPDRPGDRFRHDILRRAGFDGLWAAPLGELLGAAPRAADGLRELLDQGVGCHARLPRLRACEADQPRRAAA